MFFTFSYLQETKHRFLILTKNLHPKRGLGCLENIREGANNTQRSKVLCYPLSRISVPKYMKLWPVPYGMALAIYQYIWSHPYRYGPVFPAPDWTSTSSTHVLAMIWMINQKQWFVQQKRKHFYFYLKYFISHVAFPNVVSLQSNRFDCRRLEKMAAIFDRWRPFLYPIGGATWIEKNMKGMKNLNFFNVKK